MNRLRAFVIKMAAPLKRQRHESDLALELAAHLDMLTEDNIRAGMSELEARRAARLHFGGMEQVKEECRDARAMPFLHSLLQDARYALRGMRRSPGFTAAAATMLAIGIGINTAVFTVTYGALFRGFPNVDPDNRIAYITGSRATSWQDVLDWRAQAKSFTGIAAVWEGNVRLSISDASGALGSCDGTILSANSFAVLGKTPMLGRDFEPADGLPGAPPVAILTYGLWERMFGKDPAVVGRTIRVDKVPTTVIGVMPSGLAFPHYRVDLWMPFVPTLALLKREYRRAYFAFGRMKDGVTIRSARAEMKTIGQRLERAYPATNRGFRPEVRTFRERYFGANAAALYGSLWGAVGFVLLIACANLANFLLARAIGRAREISIRIALGAARRRIVRQLLIESVMLSTLGGAIGWLIAIATVRAYELYAWPPGNYERWSYSLDHTVFLYLAVVSVATGLLFGLAPAMAFSKLKVNAALKDGGRGATGGAGKKGLSSFLIAVEAALAVVLLAGAGVMTRSFLKVYSADLGFRPDNILTASVLLRAPEYPDAASRIAFFDRFAARLRSVPGVESLALTDRLPGLSADSFKYETAGDAGDDTRGRPETLVATIGPGYFGTMAAPIRAGRDFTDLDGASAAPAAIVSQRFADEVWPGENPLGKRFRMLVPANDAYLEEYGSKWGAWRTVVGVASNIVHDTNSGGTSDKLVYIPFRQSPEESMIAVARTRVPPASLATTFRREIGKMDPDLFVYSGEGALDGPTPLAESLLADHAWTRGFNAGLFALFAGIALLMAAFGLYAAIANSVSRRRQEIGVRMALGATARDALALVFLQGMVPVGVGLAAGLAASLAVNPLLKSQLVKVAPNDPLTMLAAPATLLVAAMLGCLIPARRAARMDPAVSLRYE